MRNHKLRSQDREHTRHSGAGSGFSLSFRSYHALYRRAPESRRLGKVDLFNAAPQCDLIEFRLDRLGKEPDLKEMMDGIPKPILISCRRKEDGGAWDGTEEERLIQLRTAIVTGPAYIELELDIADKIPRFGQTKRVVSITDTQRPLRDLEPSIEQAIAAKADVVKFTGPTPTLDAAWPLLATVTRKRQIPVVGTGLGKPGVMFSLLAHKYGAPWTYAALEKGLEAYPGQATVTEFEEIYRSRNICANEVCRCRRLRPHRDSRRQTSEWGVCRAQTERPLSAARNRALGQSPADA